MLMWNRALFDFKSGAAQCFPPFFSFILLTCADRRRFQWLWETKHRQKKNWDYKSLGVSPWSLFQLTYIKFRKRLQATVWKHLLQLKRLWGNSLRRKQGRAADDLVTSCNVHRHKRVTSDTRSCVCAETNGGRCLPKKIQTDQHSSKSINN